MQRIPRPKGTTMLALEYQKLNTDEALDLLIQHIVTYYAINGFRYQGKSVSIPDLAQKLNLPQNKVTNAISNIGTSMGNLADPEALNETAKTLLTLSTSFSLSDRGLIQSQLETLLASQAGTYKPFISSEVNKVLKLMLESNKSIQELYKAFFNTNSSTVNILNIHNKDNEQDYLTPQKALDLISDSQPALQSPPADTNKPVSSSQSSFSDRAKELWIRHSIGDNPSVREGRSGTEALRALEPSDDTHTPISQGATKPSGPHEDHFSRRGYEIVDDDSLPTSD